MPVVDITPARLDVRLSRLAPLALSLVCTTSSNNAPVDFTGCTGDMEVYPVAGGVSVLSLTTGNGRMTLTSGSIALSVTLADVLANLPAGTYKYHLVITGSGGTVFAPFVFAGYLFVESGDVA